MKLRLYVLLELLLESTCKIAWDKRKVNNILQYYFLYCLCFFLLSQISVLFTATFLDIIVPHWPKSETKNLHVTVFLFCFVFIPFIWILTETVAFFFFFLGQAMLLVRSYFPDQGLNLCPAVGSPNHWTAKDSWDCSFLRVPTQCRVLNSTALFILVVGLVSCPLWQPF